MKKALDFKNKILICLFFVLLIISLFLAPNMIGKLFGNINSVDIETNMTSKTGVVFTSNYIVDTSNISLKVYNGSDENITIKKYRNKE